MLGLMGVLRSVGFTLQLEVIALFFDLLDLFEGANFKIELANQRPQVSEVFFPATFGLIGGLDRYVGESDAVIGTEEPHQRGKMGNGFGDLASIKMQHGQPGPLAGNM